MVNGLSVGHLGERLAAVFGIIVSKGELQRYSVTGSGEGSAQQTLFSLNKKEMSERLRTLGRHVQVVAGELAAWGDEPALRQSEFDKDWLQSLLDQAAAVRHELVGKEVIDSLEVVCASTSAAVKLLSGIPDAYEEEAEFMAKIGKDGAKLVKEQQNLAKHKAVLLKKLKSHDEEHGDRDEEEFPYAKEVSEEAEKTIGKVLRQVTLHTLLCLIRNPAIRNPKEVALRKNLTEVHGQFKAMQENHEKHWGIPQQTAVMDEAAEILGLEPTAEPTAPTAESTLVVKDDDEPEKKQSRKAFPKETLKPVPKPKRNSSKRAPAAKKQRIK